MAEVNMQTLELSLARSSRDQYRNYPAEDYGKIRSAYAQIGTVPGTLYPANAGALAMQAGTSGSTLDLLFLPYNRIRLLPFRSSFRTSLAAGKVQFGIRQYTTQPKQTIMAEAADVFTNGAGGVALSAAAATAPVAGGTLMDFNLWSYKGVTLFATFVDDGENAVAITANDWFEFRVDFIAE